MYFTAMRLHFSDSFSTFPTPIPRGSDSGGFMHYPRATSVTRIRVNDLQEVRRHNLLTDFKLKEPVTPQSSYMFCRI